MFNNIKKRHNPCIKKHRIIRNSCTDIAEMQSTIKTKTNRYNKIPEHIATIYKMEKIFKEKKISVITTQLEIKIKHDIFT
mgnify:CR=1 FL=1